MFEKLVLILGIPGQWTVPVVIEHLKVVCLLDFLCATARGTAYMCLKSQNKTTPNYNLTGIL